MLAQPIMFACVLSSGSTWSMPSILAPVGDSWPTGGSASAYAVFTDTTGEILATIPGAISATAVDFVGISHTLVDPIPAGANVEVFITDASGNPYKIRYGRVVRREVTFPNAPTQIVATQAQAFSDNFQNPALGNNWVPVLGTTTFVSNAGINDVQIISIAGATAGTFNVTFGGATTATIAYNATAAAVQSALTALATIGAGNATVTGTAGNWTVTFVGLQAYKPQPLMTLNTSSLTGSVTSVVEHQTTGRVPVQGVTGSGSAAIRWASPLNTDNVDINVNLLDSGTGQVGIILCADSTFTTGLIAQFDVGANLLTLGYLNGGPTTVIGEGSVSNSVATTPDNYTITFNNTSLLLACYAGTSTIAMESWADASSLVPHGPGYRYVGLQFGGAGGAQSTGWAAQDVLAA